MVASWKYWSLVRLTSSGEPRSDEIPNAKNFFLQEFSVQTEINIGTSDRGIQRQLVRYFKADNHPYQGVSEDCLRCYISNDLKIICRTYAKNFGQNSGYPYTGDSESLQGWSEGLDQTIDPLRDSNPCKLTAEELYVLVLDGLGPLSRSLPSGSSSQSSSLIDQILFTFDPEKGSLSTWTARSFQRHKTVRRLLLEYGIESVTDWLVLNSTTTSQGLKRILQMYQRSPREIEEAVNLLKVFQSIYRTQVLSQCRKGQTYPAPTQEQLILMSRQLVLPELLTAEEVENRLKDLAYLLRQYRIRRSPPVSQEAAPLVDTVDSNLISESHKLKCLDKAVIKVLETRLDNFSRKGSRGQKLAVEFKQILNLFYCQKLGTTAIAIQLDLGHQTTVSRKLSRKKLHSDISRNLLACLADCLFEEVETFLSPHQLNNWSVKINAFLEPKIAELIQEADRKAQTSKNRCLDDPLSAAICRYISGRS